jgi:coenzyme F420 hydrogenase subunit beta
MNFIFEDCDQALTKPNLGECNSATAFFDASIEAVLKGVEIKKSIPTSEKLKVPEEKKFCSSSLYKSQGSIKEIGVSCICTGCGTCAGLCPTNAINMVIEAGIYRPFVDASKCTGCKFCVKVCPSNLLDFDELNKFVFGKVPSDRLLGNFIECSVGCSTDEKLRWNASSGGIVTALLINALEEKMIDGVLLVRLSSGNPMEPEAILAYNKADVLSASGSKYCPAPINVQIKTLLESEGKFAVVGLPCHIHGIRKAELANKSLREKIVLHIGLFCAHLGSFNAIQSVLEKAAINANDVSSLKYREGEGLGKMVIILKNGDKITIPYNLYWDCIFGTFFFTPIACVLCRDATNELSDVSVGDPWLLRIMNQEKKLTAIIARTEQGKKFLSSARARGQIKYQRIDCNLIKQSQIFNLNFKKTTGARVKFLRQMGKKTPAVIPELKSPNGVRYLIAILPLISIYLSSAARFGWMLKYIPYPLLRAYFRLITGALLLL